MPTNNPATTNNYPNPLDHYRSYSYHFIMTLASSSDAFRDQIGGGSNSISAASNQPAPLMSAILTATQPGQQITVGNSQVYLIMDTQRFSQYSVTEFEMNHQYGTGDTINPSVAIGMHRMQVIDTTGISFFNMLMDIFRNGVQSSRFSAYFLLAIKFVGHKDDGTTETVAMTFIPMNILTFGLTFSASGSIFDMTFWETEGGQRRGAPGTTQMTYMGDCKSITTNGYPNTIGGLLQSLEDKLNVQSVNFFSKYVNAATTSQNPPNGTKVGKLVQYMITCPKDWAQYPVDTAEQASNSEKYFTALTNATVAEYDLSPGNDDSQTIQPPPNFSTMKFSDATTIPDAIKLILESSTKILALQSTANRNAGKAIAFKILTLTTSDDTSFLIHYDVYPFYLPIQPADIKQQSQTNTKTTNQLNAASTATQNLDAQNQYQNVITYNYLYTGLNNEILNLDVKFDPETAVSALDTNLNIGQARLAANAAAGQTTSGVNGASAGPKQATGLYAPDLRQNDPIFVAPKTRDQTNNNAAQKNSEAGTDDVARQQLLQKQEYTQTLASVHFLSNMELDMTIRGNPSIIAKFSDRNVRGGYPVHGLKLNTQAINTISTSTQGQGESNYNQFIAAQLTTSKDAYYNTFFYPRIAQVLNPPKTQAVNVDPLLTGPDVAVHPIYVLINIRAPNVDYSGNFKANAPMYTNDFFYNGYYRLLQIQTKFQGGEFVHNCMLIPDIGITSQNDVPQGAQQGAPPTNG